MIVYIFFVRRKQKKSLPFGQVIPNCHLCKIEGCVLHYLMIKESNKCETIIILTYPLVQRRREEYISYLICKWKDINQIIITFVIIDK